MMLMTDEFSESTLNKSVSQLEFESIGLTTDNSFGFMINDTIDLLLTSCSEELGVGAIQKIFTNIQTIGNTKYINKKVMGRAGALESVYKVFQSTVGDNTVSTEGCKAIRSLILGENENKRIFGSLGICQLLSTCLSSIRHTNIQTLLIVLQLMMDLCNPVFKNRNTFEQTLRARTYKPKEPEYFNSLKSKIGVSDPLEINVDDFSVPQFVDPEMSLQYDTCNNRLNFYNANICKIVCDKLRECLTLLFPVPPEFTFFPHSKVMERMGSVISHVVVARTNSEDSSTRLVPTLSVEPVTTVVPVILPHNLSLAISSLYHFLAILAENDSLSKGFGYHGISEIILTTMQLSKYILKEDLVQLHQFIHIFNNAAFSIVILCSDVKALNKRYCNELSLAFHVTDVIAFFVLTSINHTLSEHAEYQQMMERLLWAVVMLTRRSPSAIAEISSITAAKDLLENIISGNYKSGAKTKAQELFKTIFPQ